MRKLIGAINMTIDGVCDHTAGIPDEEIHQHYTELLNEADAILYGRITFELMKYWQPMVKNPTGEKTMDEFAMAIDKIPKIVFSHTLKNESPTAIGWESAKLAHRSLEEEVSELMQSRDNGSRNILVGSRSLIIQLMKLNLMDEYQLCVHPVVAGGGLPLFENINDRTVLKLINTKIFSGGAIILYYEPSNKKTLNS